MQLTSLELPSSARSVANLNAKEEDVVSRLMTLCFYREMARNLHGINIPTEGLQIEAFISIKIPNKLLKRS